MSIDVTTEALHKLRLHAEFVAALNRQTRALRITQHELAKQTGCSKAAVSKALSGAERPSWNTVRAIIRFAGSDEEEWRRRWQRMRDATDEYLEAERRNITDGQYQEMVCPRSAVAFNFQLQLRITRNHTQKEVAERARYASSALSGTLRGLKLANRPFVEAVLDAVDAEADEKAAWLAWHRELTEARGVLTEASAVVVPALQAKSGRGVLHGVARSLMLLAIAAIAVAMVVRLSIAAPKPTVAAWIDLPTGAADSLSSADPGPVVPSPTGASPKPTAPAYPSASSAGQGAGRDGAAPTQDHSVASVPTLVPAVIGGGSAPGGTKGLQGTTANEPTDGRRINLVCVMTHTDAIGWYYTDEKLFVFPDSVRVTSNEEVPPCVGYPYVAVGVPIPTREMPCLVNLQKLTCAEARARLGNAVS